MLLTILFGLFISFFFWELLRSDCPRKSKPGKFYYTKKWLFRLLLLWNARRQKKTSAGSKVVQGDRKQRGYGVGIRDPMLLETTQALEEDSCAIDTTYFNGFDVDGTSLALRIARKHGREGELWVWLDLPGVGFLQHPIQPDSAVYNMGDEGFRAGGCEFKVIEPMRSWKVTYNGLLRKGLTNDVTSKPGAYVNVKMTFKWECINDMFNFDVDIDSNLLADSIARENWTRAFFDKVRGKHQSHYEQCGELSGLIEVEGHEPRQVYLKSFRDHTFGVRNWEMFERYVIHFIWIQEKGIMAMVASLWMPGYITFLQSGYLMYASGETFAVTDVKLDIVTLTQDCPPPNKYSFTFQAADVSYHVECFATVTPEVYHYRSRVSHILERFCTYTINGNPARGLVEFHYRNPEGPAVIDPLPETLPLLREPELNDLGDDKGQLTLTFQSEACNSSLLVGGKGSQLALLSTIQEPVGAKVTQGFCLTLEAFEAQLLDDTSIAESLDKILSAIREEKLTQLQSLCTDTVQQLVNCKIAQPIESSVTSTLKAVFGEEYEQISLAVRSSAAGEDGGEASSAGQMETFLGVRGLTAILENIRKCWASAYTFQAVEYRRQHGQPVRTSMGVVIQEMVRADVAGVIFTNHPVSGNANQMVLDASYGLGEVVVSGKTTPDTIIIQRYHDNRLEILEHRLGNKGVRMSVAEGGGTCEVETSISDKEHCCLSDEQILQLANISIKIENYFGSGRDIEWALCDNQLYLLQARPITTTEHQTDEDIIHEFDSPIVTGQERNTIGNIGEMMPGCVTPLTGSVFARAVDQATSIVGTDFGGGTVMRHAAKSITSYCSRLFINLTYNGVLAGQSVLFDKLTMEMSLVGSILTDHTIDMIMAYGKLNGRIRKLYNAYKYFGYIGQVYMHSMLYKKPALEMNLIGATLDDHTVEMIESFGSIKRGMLYKLCNTIKFFIVGNRKIKIATAWYDKLKTYTIGEHCTDSNQLYQAITEKLPDYYEIWETTIHKSARSGSYGGVVMGIVSGGKPDWTMDNYSDVALLLSQCQNVYSAEVPFAMKDIARCMVEHGLQDDFLNKTDKECVAFLCDSACPASLQQKYNNFLHRHGHRCVREAEFLEKSWRAEPVKLIKVLKTILKSEAYTETTQELVSIEETMKHLKSPVTWFGKLLLRKWIVAKARHAVGDREHGKSVAVDAADRFKTAYWRLADMLFIEGRLPERELMFFLTHAEIGHLIDTRSAKLVTKAVRRRKLLPVQSEMEFPRICIGRPQPIEKQENNETRKATFTLKGMPVSQGSVRGPARVVKSLLDADQIQRGDILIVSYTDVGWTPYFPLIAGLVTELGGLVSHGAVVAREYGLPCVVNVPDATHKLQSGDFVHLDGSNGAIHRLETIE